MPLPIRPRASPSQRRGDQAACLARASASGWQPAEKVAPWQARADKRVRSPKESAYPTNLKVGRVLRTRRPSDRVRPQTCHPLRVRLVAAHPEVGHPTSRMAALPAPRSAGFSSHRRLRPSSFRPLKNRPDRRCHRRAEAWVQKNGWSQGTSRCANKGQLIDT
jgi:hypothetical protein